MTIKTIAAILAAIIVAGAVTGCAIGNKGKVNYTRSTTIGQELIDLKEAKDKGAISDQEYEEVKKELMKCGTIKIECSSED